ncbi:hypothetical protein EMMF5_004570 [Cystobasidiomycetes sp. EMM_F5]
MPSVVQHLVLFAYKPEVSEEERKEVGRRFFSLGQACRIEGSPYILAINGGANNSPEEAGSSIHHAFIVTFRNQQERTYYLTDPAHLEFVDFIKSKLDGEKVRVADFETGVF